MSDTRPTLFHMTADKARESTIKRADILTTTQTALWARSAGRCVLCARSVLDATSYFHTVLVGEMAHNVGATDGAGSPRGASALSEDERAKEANLLLLCHDCHKRIDTKALYDLYTEEHLRNAKKSHEERVAKATNFEVMRRTLVISTQARVRGTGVHPTRREIAEAMMSAQLQPCVRDGEVVELALDLRDDENEAWVWARARKRIDDAADRLARETATGEVDHISILAIAPIPILVYLGSQLDDKVTVETFERRRGVTSEVWCWSKDNAAPITFDVIPSDPDANATDVVVVTSVSGTVDEGMIPSELRSVARVDLRPIEVTPRLGIIDSTATRDAVQVAWLQLLGEVEQRWPRAERMHILGAIPPSLAVHMGQTRARHVHPAFVVYQRDDNGTYQPTPLIED